MTIEWIKIGCLGLLFLALFGVSELIYKFGKVEAEVSRKVAHIGTGLLSLLFPVFLSSHWSLATLCALFLLLLLLSLRLNFLPSINAISRKSFGSVLYPLAVYICFFVYDQTGNKHLIYFYLPVLTLAISDPLAAYVGKTKPFGKYKRGSKTLAGSLAFMLSAFLLACVFFSYFEGDLSLSRVVLYSLWLSLVCTVLEAVSKRGVDNILVPIGALAVLYLIFG